MWKFIMGFTSGIYVGTYYDCKPIINQIQQKIKDFIPNEKSK